MPGVMRATMQRACNERGSGRCRSGLRTLALLGLLALALACGSARRRGIRARGRRRDWQALVALAEQAVELVGLERLLLDELAHDEVELRAVRREDVVGALAPALDDVVDLGVDDLRDVLGVIALLLDLAAQEDELVGLAVLQRPELLAHAELRDHLARHVGRLLDVVARARRDVTAQVELLGDPPTEGRGDVVLELVARAEVAV